MQASKSWILAISTTFVGGPVILALSPIDWWGFVVPVVMASPLIFVDLFRWGRGIYDTFDPAGLFAIIGTYHFIVAPLIHASTGYWARWLPEVDWLSSLALLCWLNLLGLILYRLSFSASRFNSGYTSPRPALTPSACRGAALGLAVATVVHFLSILHLGGISGYIRAIETRQEGSLDGFGSVFAVSESAPFLASIVYVARRQGKDIRGQELLIFFLALSMLSLVFGGARGSRNTFLWPLVFAAVLVHRYLRTIPRQFVVIGIAFLVGFSYVYGFYKSTGTEILSAVQEAGNREQLEASTARTAESLLVDDLARIGIQAWLVGRYLDKDVDFDPVFGETYIGAATLPLAGRLIDAPARTKLEVGSEIRYGPRAAEVGLRSTRVYGAAGEALLNFGLLGIPMAYFLLGPSVQFLRRAGSRGGPVLAPLATVSVIYLFLNDSDNLVFFLVKFGLFPAVVLWLATRVHHKAGVGRL